MSQSQEKKKKVRNLRKSNESVPAFLIKTYDILENPIYNNIISWNQEGTAFVVKKVNEFSEVILPKYFKHSNFASFVRQLNMYDFHKTRHDNNENEFKHKCFIRGYKSYLSQIKRKSSGSDQPQQQLTLIKNDQFPIERPFREFNELVQEMAMLSHKQSELEKLIKIIIKQNEKFQKENKYLWNELIKNKQKNEHQNDRMVVWLLQQLTNTNNKQKSNGNSSKTFTNQNNLLMLKQNDEDNEIKKENDISTNLMQFIEENGTSFLKQEPIESTLENLQNKQQLIQGLVQVLNRNQVQRNLLPKTSKLTESDQSSSENEIDPMPKKKRKQNQYQFPAPKTQDQNNQNHQLMLYDQKYQQYPSFNLLSRMPSTNENQQAIQNESKNYFFYNQQTQE